MRGFVAAQGGERLLCADARRFVPCGAPEPWLKAGNRESLEPSQGAGSASQVEKEDGGGGTQVYASEWFMEGSRDFGLNFGQGH